VFEPFFTTKDPGLGTGLGLAMVFGFVRQSDGYVRVASELGVGTSFSLFLPRAVGADSRANPAEMDSTPPRGSETILVVEDNAQLRGIVARQLGELGYRIVEAADGPAAMRILERAAIDLLMTDVTMPGGMNGLDLAHRAREMLPGLPVLIASAHVDDGGEAAMDYPVLPKPFRGLDLARAVRAALDA
jgi:CheY-like chemotaxis protein